MHFTESILVQSSGPLQGEDSATVDVHSTKTMAIPSSRPINLVVRSKSG